MKFPVYTAGCNLWPGWLVIIFSQMGWLFRLKWNKNFLHTLNTADSIFCLDTCLILFLKSRLNFSWICNHYLLTAVTSCCTLLPTSGTCCLGQKSIGKGLWCTFPVYFPYSLCCSNVGGQGGTILNVPW